jgi:hypothetical protein
MRGDLVGAAGQAPERIRIDGAIARSNAARRNGRQAHIDELLKRRAPWIRYFGCAGWDSNRPQMPGEH